MEIKRVLDRKRANNYFKQTNLSRIFLPDPREGRGRAVLLEEAGEILGVASAGENSLHKSYLELFISTHLDEFDIYIRLIKGLREALGENSRPFQFMYDDNITPGLREFLNKEGFTLTVVCDCPRIDIKKSLSGLQTSQLPVGVRILSYNDLTPSEAELVKEFRLKGYIETHFWSPPVDISDPLWSCTDLTDEEKSGSLAVFKGESVFLTSECGLIDDDFWITWGWHDDENFDSETLIQAWKSVLGLQLKMAQDSGKKVICEYDSTDRYALFRRKLLVESQNDRSYIVQQKIEGENK